LYIKITVIGMAIAFAFAVVWQLEGKIKGDGGMNKKVGGLRREEICRAVVLLRSLFFS
jgi:hypothetical protein